MRLLFVAAKPGSRERRLEQLEDGSWKAFLKSPPVDGKANAELIALVAETFGVPKSSVSIEGGTTSRRKRVRVAD